MTELLALILGTLAGYYARTIRDQVKSLYDSLEYKREYNKTGIVKPTVSKTPRSEPQEFDSGIVKQPSPIQLAVINDRERQKRIRGEM